jgi:hypothetical protein
MTHSVIATAVANRRGWPVRQPSPKKYPGGPWVPCFLGNDHGTRLMSAGSYLEPARYLKIPQFGARSHLLGRCRLDEFRGYPPGRRWASANRRPRTSRSIHLEQRHRGAQTRTSETAAPFTSRGDRLKVAPPCLAGGYLGSGRFSGRQPQSFSAPAWAKRFGHMAVIVGWKEMATVYLTESAYSASCPWWA